MTAVQKDGARDRFYDEFLFKPNCYEQTKPAIREPEPSITLPAEVRRTVSRQS